LLCGCGLDQISRVLAKGYPVSDAKGDDADTGMGLPLSRRPLV
jgi:hypothetical protein